MSAGPPSPSGQSTYTIAPETPSSETHAPPPYSGVTPELTKDGSTPPTESSMSGTLGAGSADRPSLDEKHVGHWNPNPHFPHEDNHVDEVAVEEMDGTVVTFPDGGWRAWLVVLGAGHTLFATFGFVVSRACRRRDEGCRRGLC